MCCAVSIWLYCVLYVAVLLPLLAILAHLAAGQSCSWLLINIVANLADINLAVMLIDLAVLLLSCVFDMAVLLPLPAILAHLPAGQSCPWLLANRVANLPAAIDVLLSCWSVL
jgi:hypothetical protein